MVGKLGWEKRVHLEELGCETVGFTASTVRKVGDLARTRIRPGCNP